MHGEGCYETSILIGRRDEPELELYARALIELMGQTMDQPLLLFICLKSKTHTPAMLKRIVSLVA